MECRHILRNVIQCAVLLVTQGCEYEFRDEQPSRVRQTEVIISDESRPAEAQARDLEKTQPEVASVKPVLAPGKDVSGQAALPPKVKKLNLVELLESGELVVSSNVPGAQGVPLALDEIEDTLLKSEGINPLKLAFQFKTPRTLRAVRVLSTYSDYGWAFEPEGGERLTVDTIIDGQWSTIALPEGSKCSKFSVEVLRKVRDNFVHLNEVEVYE